MENVNAGGGHINELSRAKAKLIKTPLKFHTEWNAKVNACESIEELEITLDVRLTERKYLFVLGFTSGDCFRYDYVINNSIGVNTEDLENFLTENGHKQCDRDWETEMENEVW